MLENRKIFTLHVILNRVQQVFDEIMLSKFFWIKVEVLKVNIDRKGHYYLELVEQVDDVVLAKSRATIWSRDVARCVVDEGVPLSDVVKEGAEILCYAEAVFHPVYGFSLHVTQVDYAFSLGEIERKKQAAILQLQKTGLIQRNKEKALPLVLQKIAVVASVGTSGYADFIQHLSNNVYGFSFVVDSFDTQVQGELAACQIVEQLELVAQQEYDVVVIVRGGGSRFDLDVFNDLVLAERIAHMPFAVFTGIGHETDRTVADYVAHTYFKTPSAVAAFIIERAVQFDVYLTNRANELQENTLRIVERNKSKLDQQIERVGVLSQFIFKDTKANLAAVCKLLTYEVTQVIQRSSHELRLVEQAIQAEAMALGKKQDNRLNDQMMRLTVYGKQRVSLERQQVALLEEMIVFRARHKIVKEKLKATQTEEILAIYGVENMLKKGFSIIRFNGKVLDEYMVLQEGDELEVTIHNKQYRIKLASIKEVEQWTNLLTKKQQLN